MNDDDANNKLARSMLQQGLTFAVFVVAMGLLVTLSFEASSERIAGQRSAAARSVLDEVFPAPLHDNDLLTAAFDIDPARRDYQQLALLGLSSARSAWRAELRGESSGVILPLATTGFNGPILLLVGINTEGVITGVRVIQHQETPGLGDRIEDELSPWILGFNNRSLENTPQILWQVKKDGGDFDQFVGATITPRAVVTAIHDALRFFEANRAQLLETSAQ